MSAEQRDIELDRWSVDWQSAEADTAISIDSIRRGFRRYTRSALGSWLVGLAMLLGSTVAAWRERELTLVAAAVAVWFFVAIAVAFDLHYRRGTWRLAGESTQDYVELARRQLVARLRGIRFGWALLGAETLFFAFWIPWVASREPATSDQVYLESFALLAILATAFAVGLTVMRRRAQGELERLEQARQTLASPEGST